MNNRGSFNLSCHLFVALGSFFLLFVRYWGNENFHYTAMAAMLCAGLWIYILRKRIATDASPPPWVERYNSNLLMTTLGIVALTSALGCAGFYVVAGHIQFGSERVRSVFLFSSVAGVLAAQVGGWALQSFLAYLAAVFFGSRHSANLYFNAVGISYCGYALMTIVAIFVNLRDVPYGLSMEEYNQYMSSSLLHVAMAKYGEFITTCLIFYHMLIVEKGATVKALIIAMAPGVLLLLPYLLMQKFFGS